MSGKATLKSFKKMLAEARLPEHIEPTCLRNDLAAEHEELNAELERLEKDNLAVDSLAGNGGAELADRIRELEAEMRDNTYPIRMRAMPRPDFRAFLAKYPPRVNDEGKITDPLDEFYGFDTEAGVEHLVRVSIIDPELTDDEFSELIGKLTDNQFQSLATAAIRLNRGDIEVPKSRVASRLNRHTGDASNLPTGLA